ncbi:MAG TPA: hypothetical protein VGH28_01785 [Polyangiaceae bacterium]
MRLAWTSIALVVPVVLVAPCARAQQLSDPQVAQALFDEARELMDKHDYARACPLLERSQKLDPGGGTLVNLALCWEDAGKLARANARFDEALSQARRDGRHDRETIALQHLDALAPRLPRLRLALREPVPNVVVQFDDFIEGPEVLGALTPVDPGPHHVRVSAQGRLPWEWSGTLAEGERRELQVVLREPPPPDPCILQPSLCAPPAPKKRIATATWVFGGLGLATAIASGVTGGIALSAKSSFDGNCIASRGYCGDPVQGQSDYDTMQKAAWASTITLGVAVVSVVVAIVWPRTVVPTKTGSSFLLRF